jgi:hypothetical protein
LNVGVESSNPTSHLFASYLSFMKNQGGKMQPLPQRSFKKKLVDMLRDTLGLPLPHGSMSHGSYRDRLRGSVIPCLRWRTPADEGVNGIIRYAVLAEVDVTGAVKGREGSVKAEIPVSEGCEGCEGFSGLAAHGKIEEGNSPIGGSGAVYPSHPSHPSPAGFSGVTDPSQVPVEPFTEPSWQARPIEPTQPPPEMLDQLLAARRANPDAIPFSLGLLLDPPQPTRTVKTWLAWIDEQQLLTKDGAQESIS